MAAVSGWPSRSNWRLTWVRSVPPDRNSMSRAGCLEYGAAAPRSYSVGTGHSWARAARNWAALASARAASGKIFSAKVASREIARLQQEATALRTRIASWRDAVRGTDCRAKWSVGETCYLNGRLMSETGYEREAAKLDVRSKEISHLLSSYGQAGPSPDE